MLLLVCVQIRGVMRCGELGDLLWAERHAVAELFEAVDMMTLDASPIALLKVISSQVALGFLGA